eukprot:COSAG01_NODE_1637_length_9660_cov_7.731932_5_plen_100_part_00
MYCVSHSNKLQEATVLPYHDGLVAAGGVYRHHAAPPSDCRGTSPWYFAVVLRRVICHSILPWYFAVVFCRGILPWYFAVVSVSALACLVALEVVEPSKK